MNTTRLRYFVVTAEEGSVVSAARRLGVAQPALSRQLRVLEREVGTPLFQRSARGVSLLPAGMAFLAYAQRLLVDVSAGIEAARRAAEDSAELLLRIAPPDWTCRAAPVAAALEQLSRRCPGVTVEYCAIPWLLEADAVRSGAVDVGFGVGLSLADFGSGITAEWLCDEPGSSAVLPVSHPLARRDAITMAELREIPTLLPPRAVVPLLHDQMLAMVRRAGYEPQVRAASLNFSATTQLVVMGAGWILAVNSVGRPPPPGTAVVPISDAPIMLGFYALRRTDEDRSALHLLWESIRDVFTSA